MKMVTFEFVNTYIESVKRTEARQGYGALLKDIPALINEGVTMSLMISQDEEVETNIAIAAIIAELEPWAEEQLKAA